MTTLEVLFTPAEYDRLGQRDLRETVCVVFDVLRATSSMVTALANGAAAIIPTAEISEALQRHQAQPDVLLAGEREGVRITAKLTGSIPFDLGNSPREFTPDRVKAKTVVMTTTNGTRALRACAGARRVLLGAFLNLNATVDFIAKENPADLLLVCAGTREEASYEDALGAGAMCDALWPNYEGGAVADSARIARRLFGLEGADLAHALGQSSNGLRLSALPELREDVPFCAQRDTLRLVAEMSNEGFVRKC